MAKLYIHTYDKLEITQRMMTEGARLIEDAKRNYFFKAGKTLSNFGTSSKTYWTLINNVLNEAKIPMMPPLLENGLFFNGRYLKSTYL